MKVASFLKDPLVSELFLSLSFHSCRCSISLKVWDNSFHAWNSHKFTKLSESLRQKSQLRTISCWWRKSCLCIQMAWFAVPSLLTSRVPFTSNHGWWHHVWPSVETGQICITVTILGDVICTGCHDVCITYNCTLKSCDDCFFRECASFSFHVNSFTHQQYDSLGLLEVSYYSTGGGFILSEEEMLAAGLGRKSWRCLFRCSMYDSGVW